MRCQSCLTYHDYDEYTFELKSVTFFKEIDKHIYQITHYFDKDYTNISIMVTVQSIVSFKDILKINIVDINPSNVEFFLRNKLKLYTVFS